MARGLVSGIALVLALMPIEAYADPVTVVVAVASAAAAGAGGIILGTAVAFSWAAFGVSLALSALSYAFSPKAKSSASSYGSIKSSGMTQQFRQPLTSREIVYGEVRKSGPIVYVTSTSSNKYLHMMIVLASHEVQEIGEIIVDDYPITDDMLDASGGVISGRYAAKMRIRKHLGTTTQTADTLAVSEIPEWTTDHRLQGMAYIYVRLEWDRDVFPNGIPNFSAWVKGKKLFDPRSATTYWSPNTPLFIRDYLNDGDLGMNVTSQFIDDDSVETAANVADEYVVTNSINHTILSVDTANEIITLNGDLLEFVFGDKVWLTSGAIGGLSSSTDYYVMPYQRQGTPRIRLASSYANALSGTAINITSGTSGILTKKAEPRYHGGGVLNLDAEPASNLAELYLSMAGTITNTSGKWKIYSGAFRSASVYFDENDLVGALNVTTKVSKQDRFNRIQGAYTSFINNGNTSDYPLVKNDFYAAQDGQVILKTRDLPFVQRPHTAQRVAKAELERMRQEISFTAQFKLTAFKAQIADSIYFSFERYGWTNKLFEVMNWRLTVDGDAPVIEMTCRETAPTIYDWDSAEETQVDPAPNSNLPSIFDVSAPTSLAVFPVEVETSGAPVTYKFNMVWTPPVDQYVINGGQFEIQFKESLEAEWRPSYFIDGEQTFTDLYQVNPVINYDARIRSVNFYGVRSAWSSILGFTVGAPAGVTDRFDYGLFSDSVTSSLDYGLFSATVTTSEDYGSFV